MDTAKAKAVIRQLLNLAADESAAKGEIENAMRFAARLMEQHHLSDDDLGQVDTILLNLERAAMAREGAHFGGAKRSCWETSAAAFTSELVGGVKWYWSYETAGITASGAPRYKPVVSFYGVAEDVEIVRQLFIDLITMIAAMARLKWGGVYRGPGRSYCEGFMSGLWKKLQRDRDSQKDISQHSAAKNCGSTALAAIEHRSAIIDRKRELADAYLEDDLKINLRKGHSFSSGATHDVIAFDDGKVDGQQHSVSAERRPRLPLLDAR